MLHWLRNLLLPPQWHLPMAVACGALAGLLLTAGHVSRAWSYLLDRPEVCVNCHLMTSEYVRWHRGAHRDRATCNDCHLRHENVVTKYLSKADSGLRHMAVYSAQAEPMVIRAIARSSRTIHDNCIRCHGPLVDTMSIALHAPGEPQPGAAQADPRGRACTDCHRDTPHSRISSLVSAPDALAPRPGRRTAPWLDSLMLNQ